MPISQGQVDALNDKYKNATPQQLMTGVLTEDFPGQVSLVSSFGTESAVLLHMASQIDKTVDVVFINTGKLFGETMKYKNKLVEQLGLSHVRAIMPKPALLDQNDPRGVLWSQNADRCCYTRKVEPMQRALKNVNIWISGRKGFHGAGREALPLFELVEGRIKINPLAKWSKTDLDAYFESYALPKHPLEADGYLSVGCMPCTTPVSDGEDMRAGRWRGSDKTECGIHMPVGQPGRRSILPAARRGAA
ncbi:MAG: phosphoadenylyl-sulfate reductase [Pseudomonadota bacterium]